MLEPAKASVFRGEHIVPNPKAKRLEQVREDLRFMHYSLRTEETCVEGSVFDFGNSECSRRR